MLSLQGLLTCPNSVRSVRMPQRGKFVKNRLFLVAISNRYGVSPESLSSFSLRLTSEKVFDGPYQPRHGGLLCFDRHC